MKYKILLLILFVNWTHNAQFNNTQLHKIDILSYDFDITISDTTNKIEGLASVKFVRQAKVNVIQLNLKNPNTSGSGMQVSKVKLEGKPLHFKHEKDTLTVFLPPQKDTLQIQVAYKGKPQDGLYIKKNKYRQRTFFGDNWPNRAQYWLPVIDHPSDKALVSWTITTPKHYQVIASGRLVSKINDSKNRTWYFKTDVSLPTKVMVFAAADFNIKNLDRLYLHQKCVPVSSWIYTRETLKAFDDFKPSLKALQFYDSIIGSYDFSKLANVQSNTRFGGMENAGNIFYDEQAVNGRHQIENLVAHEVAHQWFGNSLTEKNWRDIWLSEGFATYLNDLYLEHFYGKQKLKERMTMERQKVIRFSKKWPYPVVYDENNNLFRLLNPNSYEKGAWVLHMLRYRIRDKAFFKLLKTFYQTYELKNASTEDFITMAEEISGQDLKNFFKQWLYRPGIPKLKIDMLVDKKDKSIALVVEQMTKPYELSLPVTVKSGQKSFQAVLNISKNIERIKLKLPSNWSAGNITFSLDEQVRVLFEKVN